MAAAAVATTFLLLLLLGLAVPGVGGVLFSTLPRTVAVSASPKPSQVLAAGVDNITVTWRLNATSAAGAAYKTAKLKLCYAPVSQEDRGWRKTKDDLSKDKTCQFTIATVPFGAGTVTHTVETDVPTATYFVRVYVLNADGTQIAYGQTTDAKKKENLFQVNGVSGRHGSIDAAASCFSAASLLILVGFIVAEKRKGKK